MHHCCVNDEETVSVPMKRNPRPWTKDELALLGKLPDADVADLTGRTFGRVWQKRRALGIDQPELRFRKWTRAEDKLVGTAPDADTAHQIDRTESAVKSRRTILERQHASRETKPIFSDPKPSRAAFAAFRSQSIPRYSAPRSTLSAQRRRVHANGNAKHGPRADWRIAIPHLFSDSKRQ